MASDHKWLQEDFQKYGIVQLDADDPPDDSLTLKSPPEIEPTQKLTLKQAFQVDTSIVLLRLKKAI